MRGPRPAGAFGIATLGRARHAIGITLQALTVSLAGFAAGCAQFEPPAARVPPGAEPAPPRQEPPPIDAVAPVALPTPSGATLEPDAATATSATVATATTAAPARGEAADVAPEDPAAPAAPRMRLDPDQDAERADLWQRVRDGMRIADLDGELVRRWEQRYASQPDYLQRMVERGSRYLFHIVEEIERRDMPMELALLPFVESAFNPEALSRARAAGMWQFMPGTGREYDLRQNVFRDDRRDVLASTRAALDFLAKLHARFGDWQLALAAYNWGPGNVAAALERNRRAKKPLDLASLQRLPAETRNYVPKLQAMKNIVLEPQAFGVELGKLENHPYFLSVAIERDIDLELAARLAGLSVEQFRQLNPQHNRAVILSAGTPHVLLPYDNANQFVRALAEHRGPLARWTAWVAPRTLRTGEAATLVGMSESALAEVNHIPPRMLVRAGSTLIVARGAAVTSDVSERLADNGTLTLAPEGATGGRQTTLRAGPKGDTVAAVARRHGLAAEQVAQWNRVSKNAKFAPGQPVVLVLPVRSRAVVAGAGARGARAAPRGAPAAPAQRPAPPASRVKVATN